MDEALRDEAGPMLIRAVESIEPDAMLMTGTAARGPELDDTVMAGVDALSMLTFSPDEIEYAMLKNLLNLISMWLYG